MKNANEKFRKIWSEQSNGLGHVAMMQSKFILRKTRKV